MASCNDIVDFSSIESFHLLYKNLWSANIAYRIKLKLVDTVLYKDGNPYCWLFTSEQTGEIMKKKHERLTSPLDIIRTIKLKSREYSGSKELLMRNKVAIIWYLESERNILSHIVDEIELKSILDSKLTEVLCIQAYIGGIYLRGNGVFEHRMWTQKDGTIRHITYEAINMQRDCLDRFSCESEKLVISEHQHGALTAISKQLMTHMAFVNKCKVSGMVFQAVFSEGWVPHIIAAKRFSFAQLPQQALYAREELVYPMGKVPSAPTINPNSLLLPRSATCNALQRCSQTMDAELAAVDAVGAEPIRSFKVRSASMSYIRGGISNKYPNFNNEQERKAVVAQRQVSASSQQAIDTAVDEASMELAARSSNPKSIRRLRSPNRKASVGCAATSQVGGDCQQPETERLRIAAAEACRVLDEEELRSRKSSKMQRQGQSPQIYADDAGNVEIAVATERFKPPLMKRAQTTGNLNANSTKYRSRIDSAHHNVSSPLKISELQVPYVDLTREPSRVAYGCDDHYATVHMGTKPSALHQLQQSKSTQSATSHAPLPVEAAKRSTSAQDIGGAAECEESRRASMMRTSSLMDHSLPGKSTPIVRTFRPGSANSVVKLRQTMDKAKTIFGASSGQLGSTSAGRRGVGSTAVGAADGVWQLNTFEMNTETSAAQTSFSKNQRNDDEAALKEQSKVFDRRRPISAPHTMRPRSAAPKELDGEDRYNKLQRFHSKGFSLAKVLPLSGTLCFGSYCNFNVRAKNAAVNDNHQVKDAAQERCADCPQHLAYKSILLAKAETRFLGVDLDENIESLIDQIRLSELSTEQMYTYFVRRHLNKVAQKCQEEGRKMQLSTSTQHQQQLKDVNLIYRQLVYADALGSIHPSRFYYTVPLCAMCYQIYTFLDAEREVLVLHSVNNHQIAAATAAASAEKAQFKAVARSDAEATRNAKRSGVPLGLDSHGRTGRRVPTNPLRNAAAADGDDPYQCDENINTDQFIPHHSAQRDIFSDHHKKDSFATTLRKNVATLTAKSEKVRRGDHGVSVGALEAADLHVLDTAPSTPPHSARRKVVMDRDRVPVNPLDGDRFNATFDSGIGSRGPVHPDQIKNENRAVETLSNWVKLLNGTTVRPLAAGTSADYSKMHSWTSNQEWDKQGSTSHTKPTAATVNRVNKNRERCRPHSALGHQRNPYATAESVADSSGLDLTKASAHVKFASGSRLQYSASRDSSEPPSTDFNIAPLLFETAGEYSGGAKSKRRPRSAGAVPYRIISAKDKKMRPGADREDSIAALEVELANKMLELSDHLERHQLRAVTAPVGGTVALAQPPLDSEDEDSMEALYAYSSLPFMAAQYFPSQGKGQESVANAAYSQLQIDPVQHRVIPPQATPEQLRQRQLEIEQRGIQERIHAEKEKLRREEEIRIAQLQLDRQQIKEQQLRLQRSASHKVVPSTDFTPVSAEKVAFLPEYTEVDDTDTEGYHVTGLPEYSTASDEAVEKRLPEEDYLQEQYFLRLQQQKELRDFQHQQQQRLHQKHQQELHQQQLQYQGHLKQQLQKDEGKSMTEDGHAEVGLQETYGDDEEDFNIGVLVVPPIQIVSGGGWGRDSVELSPMSPPIFEYLEVQVAVCNQQEPPAEPEGREVELEQESTTGVSEKKKSELIYQRGEDLFSEPSADMLRGTDVDAVELGNLGMHISSREKLKPINNNSPDTNTSAREVVESLSLLLSPVPDPLQQPRTPPAHWQSHATELLPSTEAVKIESALIATGDTYLSEESQFPAPKSPVHSMPMAHSSPAVQQPPIHERFSGESQKLYLDE